MSYEQDKLEHDLIAHQLVVSALDRGLYSDTPWGRQFARLDASKAFANAYQASQRSIDKEINPGFYRHSIGPDGQELMIEKFTAFNTEFGQ